MDLSRTPTKRDAGHDQYGSDTPPQKIVQDSPQSSSSGSHPPDEQSQLASWRGYEGITNWRHCQSVEDLTKIFTLTDTAIKNLQGKLEESHSQSFLEFLVEDAEEYIDSLFRHLRSTNTQGIDYSFFPAKSAKDMDKLISVYLELMRIYRMFRGRCAGQYVELLLKIIPKPVDKKVKVSTTAVTYPAGIKLAFCQQPTSGRDTVTPLLHDICDLFNTFWNTRVEYMAPYTSLLGPSGLGKSYTVRQIAKQNLGFVVYTCLTRERSGTYPPRSIFADLLLGDDQDTDLTHIVDEDLRREVLTSLYECYVAAGVVNVRLCRKFGITPSIFYDCQVEDGFSKFQKACAEALKLLFRTVRAIHEKNHVQEVKRRIRSDETGNDTGFEIDENVEIQLSALQFDHLEHVDKCINIYEEAAEAIFSSIRKELETVAPYKALLHTVGAGLSAQEGQPAVLFCVDEVNELFRTRADDHDPLRLLALRRAFRNRSRVSPTETDKKFFALLSDTSSNVSYITPSYDRDPSAKFKRHLELLRPIYILDSLDMFAEDGRNAAGDRIDLSRLFSVGRPLWGAYIREPSLGLSSAINVAHLKAGCGRDISASSESISPTEALALFSYRMGFYVSRRELAEKLASGYLHYFVSISDDRRFIRTKVPSEPILAHASAVQTLRKPGSRSAMIAHFYSNLTNGSIHVGDIGELVATWVFLFTMDKVLDPDNYRPIDLMMFLKTLLSPSLSSSVLLHMDASPELKQLLKEGTVFFNHFSRCHDPVSRETLEYAYFRGAAILPPIGYKGADIILPIHRRGQDKFSYILVQVKNRQNDVLGDGLEKESRRSCEDAASLLGPEVPYLGILMSLRSKAGQEDAKITYPFEKTPDRETRQSNNPKGPPRVILTSLGLSESLYPGVAFPGEAYAVAETALIVQYLRDLVECNTDMAMAKHLITFYHERLIPLRRRGHAVSGQ